MNEKRNLEEILDEFLRDPEDAVPAESIVPEDMIPTDIPAEETPVEESPIEETPVIPVGEMPSEEPIAEEFPSEEIAFEESEKVAFDPDAFIPEDPDDSVESILEELRAEGSTDEAAADPLADIPAEYLSEPELSSGYMDNYPVMPESVEIPVQEEKPEVFDDGGEFEHNFKKKNDTGKRRSEKERPTRKGRPRRPKGYGLLGIPHMLATVVWLLLIVAIGVSMGRMLWVCAADVLAFGREEKIVTISITTNDTMESIAQKLQNAGLVRYPELFLLYADLTDAEEKITTGSFTLNTVYDYHALVNQMSPRSGNRVVIEDVLIPEGYNCQQIFALLEQKGICKAADLEAWAASGELDDYWFLEGIERGDKYCLEGFLFPDTYDFYENSTPKAALEKMLDGFDYRFSAELYDQLPALNAHISEMMRKNGKDDAYIASHQLDLRGLITVASLIEEETASSKESYNIASVIYNRLYNWGSNPPYLNIDAAIFYALGEHKSALTAEDLQIDSLYNTYRYQGLVPGPITNPGLDSIKAALDPEETSYYYYVLNPEAGLHDFSKTLEEHEKKVDKYLRGG